MKTANFGNNVHANDFIAGRTEARGGWGRRGGGGGGGGGAWNISYKIVPKPQIIPHIRWLIDMQEVMMCLRLRATVCSLIIHELS